MRQPLLTTVAAIGCLALPVAGFADPASQAGGPGRHDIVGQTPVHGHGVTGGSAGPATTFRPHGGGPVMTPNSRTVYPGQGAAAPTAPGFQAPAPRHQPFSRPAPLDGGQGAMIVPRSQSGFAGHAPRDRSRLGDWSPGLQGPDLDQAGRQWRQGHSGWDRRSPWRGNSEWWRGHRAFRNFYGPRLGFFFIPEFGYVSVPEELQQRYWVPGEYLPAWFWRYVVRDYWNYNLPQPPEGCAWVWVDNDVALIQLDDGYILDIVHNAW